MPKPWQTTYRNIAISFGIAMFFLSCSLDQQDELGEKRTDFPSRTLVNAEISYSDRGETRFDLRTPLMEEYSLMDSGTYRIFPKGINMEYFEFGHPDSIGFMKANWAKQLMEEAIIKAVGDVELINPQGDTLRSDTIYWNQKKKLIHTTDTVRIYRLDGDRLLAAKGMEASQDFQEYKFARNRGLLYVSEDEEF